VPYNPPCPYFSLSQEVIGNTIRFRLDLLIISAGARAFEVEGPIFFIDFSPGKACLHNAINKYK